MSMQSLNAGEELLYLSRALGMKSTKMLYLRLPPSNAEWHA